MSVTEQMEAFATEPVTWVYCSGCKCWIDNRAVFILDRVGDKVKFNCPACEQVSESQEASNQRPITAPDTFTSEEAGEGAATEE